MYKVEKRDLSKTGNPNYRDGWRFQWPKKSNECICGDEYNCKSRMKGYIDEKHDKFCAFVVLPINNKSANLVESIREIFPQARQKKRGKILIRSEHFAEEDLLPENQGPKSDSVLPKPRRGDLDQIPQNIAASPVMKTSSCLFTPVMADKKRGSSSTGRNGDGRLKMRLHFGSPAASLSPTMPATVTCSPAAGGPAFDFCGLDDEGRDDTNFESSPNEDRRGRQDSHNIVEECSDDLVETTDVVQNSYHFDTGDASLTPEFDGAVNSIEDGNGTPNSSGTPAGDSNAETENGAETYDNYQDQRSAHTLVLDAIELLRETFVKQETPLDPLVMGLVVDLLDKARYEEFTRQQEQNPKDKNANEEKFAPVFPVYYLKDEWKVQQSKRRYYAEVCQGRTFKKQFQEAKKLYPARYRKVRVNIIRKVTNIMCAGEGPKAEQAILSSLVAPILPMLTIQDCVAIRDYCVVSTTKLHKIMQSISILTGMKRFWPSRFMKSIGELENEYGVEVDFKMVEVNVSKGKSKCVVFYFVKQLPYVFEMLLASAIEEGKYEMSKDFSNFEDYELFGRGVDRAGGDVYDMVRLINRKDGNAGTFCIPINVLEMGSEDYENLQSTIFSGERNKIFSCLENKEVHFLSTWFEVGGQDSGSRNENTEEVCSPYPVLAHNASAIMVKFLCSSMIEFDVQNLQVSVETRQSPILLKSQEDSDAFVSSAVFAREKDRTMPTTIKLDAEDLIDASTLPISVSFVQEYSNTDMDSKTGTCSDSDSYQYIGCMVHATKTDNLLLSFRFASKINVKKRSKGNASCRRARLVNSDDGKMTTTVMGLGSCSSAYPCPCCTWRKNELTLPTYFNTHHFRSLIGEEALKKIKFKDYERREGENSNEVNASKAERLMGTNKEFCPGPNIKQDKKYKGQNETCHSVHRAPLRSQDIDFVHGDSMHIAQGLVTHHNSVALEEIKNIRGSHKYTSEWAKNGKEKALADVRIKIKEIEENPVYVSKAKEFERLHKQFVAAEKRVKIFRTASASEETSTNPDDDPEEIFDAAQHAYERIEDFNSDGEFGLLTRKLRGLKEFEITLKRKYLQTMLALHNE